MQYEISNKMFLHYNNYVDKKIIFESIQEYKQLDHLQKNMILCIYFCTKAITVLIKTILLQLICKQKKKKNLFTSIKVLTYILSVWGLQQGVLSAGEPEDPPALPHGGTSLRLSALRLYQGLQQLLGPRQAPENSPRHGT